MKMKKLLASALAAAMVISSMVGTLVTSAAETVGTITAGTVNAVVGETDTIIADINIAFPDGVVAPHNIISVALEGYTLTDVTLGEVTYTSATEGVVSIDADGSNLAAGKVLLECPVDSKAPTVTAIALTATFVDADDVDTVAGTYAIVVNGEDMTDVDEADIAIDAVNGSLVVAEPHVCDMQTKYDENGHWTECDCGEKTDVVPHVLGDYVANEDGTTETAACDCGYTTTRDIEVVGPVEPVVDSNITFRSIEVAIGACLEMKIRVTKNTISADYASYDLVVVPTKYDTEATNAFNEKTLEPIVLTNEPTSSYNVYWYKDVAMYELGLNIDIYVRCYDAQGNMVATSEVQHVVPSTSLLGTYNSTTNAKLKTVIADLLNMGTYAQVYFGNNNTSSDLKATVDAGEFVNIGINQSDATAAYGDLNASNDTVWNPESVITSDTNRMAVNLVASKAPSIQYVIYKGTSLDRSKINLAITYKSNNGEDKVYNVTGDMMTVAGTRLTYSCSELAYYDSNAVVNTTFTYDGVEVWTNTYSVESGVTTNLSSTNANLVSLMDAIAKFGISARAFTGYGA